MYFQIKKLILWARQPKFKYKEIEFSLGKVNVITGASRTGKSAIIPIIDYCLGSKECTIPVNTIRDACSWFGVIVDAGEYEMLFARPEPGMKKSTDDMMFIMDKKIEVPEIPQRNNNRDRVCRTLDELAKITFLEINNEEDNGFNARPSFRDMMAFCYQPQNIIANANTLFYKADTTDHRQKLINIFPYILGAVDSNVLAKRKKLDTLRKELKRKEKELKELRNISEKWDIEIRSWLKSAQSIGLLDKNISIQKLNYSACVDTLAQIAQSNMDDVYVTTEGLNQRISELNALRKEEQRISYELAINMSRKKEMDMFYENINTYRENLSIQRERLDISSWLLDLANENGICPFCGSKHYEDDQIQLLFHNLKKIEMEEESIKEIPISFDREYELVSGAISELTEKLNAIQKSIRIIEWKCKEDQNQQYTLEEIAKFVGKAQYAEETFRNINSDGELQTKIDSIKYEIEKLSQEVNEYAIKKRMDVALGKIQNFIMMGLPTLDVEDPNAPVKVDFRNLTIKIKNKTGREDYLWEIGSGSNWLAYHIAVSIAFQRFAILQEHSPIPQFLIYDQPSQVYFPRKTISHIKDEDIKLSDEDMDAVMKLFKLMDNSVQSCKNNLQIIVLEHAGENVWNGLNNIYKVCEWRGENNKLIPEEWIEH